MIMTRIGQSYDYVRVAGAPMCTALGDLHTVVIVEQQDSVGTMQRSRYLCRLRHVLTVYLDSWLQFAIAERLATSSAAAAAGHLHKATAQAQKPV